jgi:hypothetical protein
MLFCVWAMGAYGPHMRMGEAWASIIHAHSS